MKILGEEVFEFQLEELFKKLPFSIAGLFFASSLITFALYLNYKVESIFVWYGLMLFVLLIRFLIYKFHNKLSPKTSYILYLFTIAMTGIVFTSEPWFFFPQDYEYQIFLVLLFVGVVSGGILQTAYTKRGLQVFLIFYFLPLLGFFDFYYEKTFYFLVIAVIGYIAFIIKMGMVLYDEYLQANFLQDQYDFLIREFYKDRQRMEHFFNYTPVGMFFYDKNLVVTHLNNYLAEKIIEAPKEKIKGFNLNNAKDKSFLPVLRKALEEGYAEYEGHYHTTMTNKDLFIKLVASRVDMEEDYEGVAVLIDFTEAKEANKKIEFLSYNDTLTEIYKREILIQYLEETLNLFSRKKEYSILLLFDVDKFKDINDYLGHQVGDYVLKELAKRIKQTIRKSDIFARIGGDEFGILVPFISESKKEALLKATQFAQKVCEISNKEIVIENNKNIKPTVSIGIVIIDNSFKSSVEVLKAADIAMNKAKEDKNNCFAFFDDKLFKEIQEKYKLKDEIINGIQNDEFELFLQAKVDKNQKITSAEALIRWNHPTRGLLSPFYFLDIVFEFNLTSEFTKYVIRKAKEISKNLPSDFSLSLNITAEDIMKNEFIEFMEKEIKDFNCKLDLELTEQMLVENIDFCLKNMKYLEKLGISFSLDDFGTGYSSLSYLKKLPVHYLKIDKSFVDDMLNDENDLTIVNTIISMAKALNLETVAEGVETKAQFEKLKSLGCDYFQGYYFYKPLPFEEFKKLL